MKGRLKHIPKTTASAISGGNSFSIKKALKEAGYAEHEIKEMLDQDRILISRPNLRRGLKSYEKLYVLETEKDMEDEYLPNEVDRFRNLDIE